MEGVMRDRVEVVIDGRVFTLTSTESPEYLQKVALHVSQKIADLKAKNLSAVVDDRLRPLLIALNLADDYLKVKERYTAQDVETQELVRENKRLEKENAASAKQIKELKAELEKVSTEYEEFLYNFDNPKKDSNLDAPVKLTLGNTRKAAK